MIFPIRASEAYRRALHRAIEKLQIDTADREAYRNFCLGFLEGWSGSKHHTLEILESVSTPEQSHDDE